MPFAYTAAQQQAIDTIDQNLQIIACAGSGKTQVISARIVELLAAGVPPAGIIAFTFTEKAAGELKDRINRLALERLGTSQGLGDIFIGTIHGYCLQLLQSPPLYKYLKYTVLDDIQQRLLIDRHSTQSGLTSTPLLAGGTLSRWLDSALYQQLIAILTEGSVDMQQVPAAVQDAVAQYRQLLHDQRYLDYTMIISEAVQALQTNTQLQNQLRGQLQHLVVDEYQDVNPLQERLIRHLHDLGATLCVVGDDDQTIYQWRGSEVKNIITFAQRYPDVQQIKLNENFRSSVGIVESARQVVERNPERLPKRMETTHAQPFDFGDLLALQFSDPDSEADWIVAKIKHLIGAAYQDRPGRDPRGLTYSDVAILLRSVRKDAGPIIQALDRAGIPFIVGGINELFATPEAHAMRALFYHMADFTPPREDPVDEQALTRLLAADPLHRTPAQIRAGLHLIRRRKQRLAANRTDARIFLQRLYLDFLEAIQLREEDVQPNDGRSGEIIFYNLGKFSQVITDYEQIHFKSDPQSLYTGFASFLHYQAPGYYPEGWEDDTLTQPDAVQILTVHKAKGMQWPAVFIPCLRRNRFPSKRHGGRQVWHIIPETAVKNVERYKGTTDDERRLFYVALTRAERFCFATFSPVPDNNLYKKISKFHHELTSSPHVLTNEPPFPAQPDRLPPRPRREEITLPLTFSELKYYFDCPYSFKLRFLYGFNEPVSQAIGYGKSLHDALAEIHSEAIRGHIPDTDDVPRLVDTHLHLPFARQEVWDYSREAAQKALTNYLHRNRPHLDKLEHVEKTIELKLADGIVVNGRIDLIRHTDTGHTVIVDFKSSDRAQAEEITRQQLQVYALGYQQLTGQSAHLIEVHNLDHGGSQRELINPDLIQTTIRRVQRAGANLRNNHLPRLDHWNSTCTDCGVSGVCRDENGLSEG